MDGRTSPTAINNIGLGQRIAPKQCQLVKLPINFRRFLEPRSWDAMILPFTAQPFLHLRLPHLVRVYQAKYVFGFRKYLLSNRRHPRKILSSPLQEMSRKHVKIRDSFWLRNIPSPQAKSRDVLAWKPLFSLRPWLLCRVFQDNFNIKIQSIPVLCRWWAIWFCLLNKTHWRFRTFTWFHFRWSANQTTCRSNTETSTRCHDPVLKLLTHFTLATDLPDCNFFATAHQEDSGNGNSLRMLMYPSRDQRPEATRMIEHTGSGSVPLLFQHQPGLEVFSPTKNGSKLLVLQPVRLFYFASLWKLLSSKWGHFWVMLTSSSWLA